MKKKGFTLIELMVVIAIIGLLAAIALPKFGDVTSQAKVANVQGNLSSLRTSIAMFYATDGDYPDLITDTAYNDLTKAEGTDSTGAAIDFTDYFNKSVMPDTPAGKLVATVASGDVAVGDTVQITAGNVTAASSDGTTNGGWVYTIGDGTILADLAYGTYVAGTDWSEQ